MHGYVPHHSRLFSPPHRSLFVEEDIALRHPQPPEPPHLAEIQSELVEEDDRSTPPARVFVRPAHVLISSRSALPLGLQLPVEDDETDAGKKTARVFVGRPGQVHEQPTEIGENDPTEVFVLSPQARLGRQLSTPPPLTPPLPISVAPLPVMRPSFLPPEITSIRPTKTATVAPPPPPPPPPDIPPIRVETLTFTPTTPLPSPPVLPLRPPSPAEAGWTSPRSPPPRVSEAPSPSIEAEAAAAVTTKRGGPVSRHVVLEPRVEVVPIWPDRPTIQLPPLPRPSQTPWIWVLWGVGLAEVLLLVVLWGGVVGSLLRWWLG